MIGFFTGHFKLNKHLRKLNILQKGSCRRKRRRMRCLGHFFPTITEIPSLSLLQILKCLKETDWNKTMSFLSNIFFNEFKKCISNKANDLVSDFLTSMKNILISSLSNLNFLKCFHAFTNNQNNIKINKRTQQPV